MQQRTLRADVGSIRAIWAIQDKLALDAEEEKAIELKRELVGGQERMIWNPSTSIAAQKCEFDDAEITRIRVAIQGWENYGVSQDRKWLAPLIEAVFRMEPQA
jgi:hypothetical protein